MHSVDVPLRQGFEGFRERFIGCSRWDCLCLAVSTHWWRRRDRFIPPTYSKVSHSIEMTSPERSRRVVSVALSSCQFRICSSLFSKARHPILRRGAYVPSPAFCCLDFPPSESEGKSSSSQSAPIVYRKYTNFST